MFADPGSLAAIIWGGRRLIGASVVMTLLAVTAYLATAPRVYQATAKVLVIEHGVTPLVASGAGQARLVEGVEDSIPTHVMIVSSPIVIRRAVESIGLNNLPSIGSRTDLDAAARQVTAGLSVGRPDHQAKVLQVSHRSSSRDESVRIVKAVVDSYQSFLDEVYARGNSEVVVLMTRAREDLSRELKELERKYLEFRQNTSQITTDSSGRTFLNQRVEEWNRASRDTMVKAVHLKTQLELGKELARSGVGLWSIAYAMDQLAPPGAAGGLAARAQSYGPAPPSDYLRQLAIEQQKLSDTLGPQSTKVKEIQEQISQAQVQSRATRGRIEQGEVEELLSSVSKSLASLETMRGEIQAKFETDLTQAKKAEIDQLAETNLKNELERHRTLFNTVVDQLKQARLVGDFAGTRAQVIEPPNALSTPVLPRTSLTLMLALAAGTVFGLGAALGAELVAPRVRSVAEMRRVLRLPLLGQVPFVPESQVPPSRSLGLICQEMPRSPSAEAYRLVRANLDLARRSREARVVLVTAPHSGCGQSTVAANLAVALAQAGRKVALVDADLRSPSQHSTFGLIRERGLSHLLRELMPVPRVLQPTRVPNLELIASGPETHNPSELLSARALADVLTELRERHETVIIDAPPLLDFADASILAATSDAVVLVVRMGTTRRADAARAVETLQGVGTPVLGAVINGAAPERPPVWRRVPTGWLTPEAEPESTSAMIPFDPQMTFSAPPAPSAPWPPVSNLLTSLPWSSPSEGGF